MRTRLEFRLPAVKNGVPFPSRVNAELQTNLFRWLPRLDSNHVKGFAPRGQTPKKQQECFTFTCSTLSKTRVFTSPSPRDLKRRMAEHEHGASLATKYRGPWKLIYYDAYIDRQDAEGRELYLKSGGGRKFLRQQLRHYLEKFPARQAD